MIEAIAVMSLRSVSLSLSLHLRKIKKRLSNQKSPPQFVSWINDELMSTCNKGPTAYFRHDSIIRTSLCLPNNASIEDTRLAQNAFYGNLLAFLDFAFRMQ